MRYPGLTVISRRALTLVELLGVVAITVVLLALLFPALRGIIGRANESKCISNLKQISVASAAYSADHDGYFPKAGVGIIFSNDIMFYLGKVPARGSANFMNSPLICPAAKTSNPDSNYHYNGIYTPTSWPDPETGEVISKYGLSYAQNIYASPLNVVPKRSNVALPSQMFLYMDYQGNGTLSLGAVGESFREERLDPLEKRHNKLLNTAFVDGSIRSIRLEDIPKAPQPSPHLTPFWQGQ